jgi:hypothetical protein
MPLAGGQVEPREDLGQWLSPELRIRIVREKKKNQKQKQCPGSTIRDSDLIEL